MRQKIQEFNNKHYMYMYMITEFGKFGIHNDVLVIGFEQVY